MQITLEDDSFMYIYLKSIKNHKKIGKCISDVRCFLFYDEFDNLIGLEIMNTRDNTQVCFNGIPLIEKIKLPNVGYVDTPLQNATITETENEISIMFNADAVIHRVKEDKCNIDICKEGILGIEQISFNNIGRRETINPFIIEDTLLK